MKKVGIFSAATLATMIAVPALGGTIETVAPAPVVAAPVVADFSGAYASVFALGSRGRYGNDTNFPGDGSGDLSGAGAGVALGYLWQNNTLTFGPELNLAMPNASGSEDCVNPTFQCAVDVERLASLRANVGVVVGPKTMLFGTAGVALASVNAFVDNGTGPQGETRNLRGWVVGLGVEHKVRQNMSVRAAVNHYRFNGDDFQTDILYSDISVDSTTLEIGVNFRF